MRSLVRSPALLTLALVLLVWIGAGLALPGFTSWGHIRYLLELAAVIGIAAAGQTLVVLKGGIDLSTGAVMTVSAILLPLISPAWDVTGATGILVTLGLATGIGTLNGLGAVALKVPPIIMTLAMATLLQGLLVIVAGGSAVTVSNPSVTWLGSARPLGLPAGVWLWAAVAIGMVVLLSRGVAGPRILALGANARAAVLSGVREGSQTVGVFAASGLFSGLAGVLLLGMNRQGYVGIGEPYVLTSIAAVVLGGTSILGGRGSYVGTIPGALLLVTASALITMVDASAGWRNIMFGALILGLLLVSGREGTRH